MDAQFPVSGRLRDQHLPRILVQLQREKKTGILAIGRNDQHKSIFIKDGDIIFASSKYEDDWLGVVLLKLGKISLIQYDQASQATQKTQKRLGAVLVEQGVLSPKDLFGVVTHQVKEIILSLFTWLDGDYRFEEGSLPAQEVITLKMSTANLILDGIRRINDFIRLRNDLPTFDTILKITSDPLILFQDIELAEPERKLLLQVDGKSSVSQLFAASDLPAFDTLKLLTFFLSVGLVEIGTVEPKTEPVTQSPAVPEGSARDEAPKSPVDDVSKLNPGARTSTGDSSVGTATPGVERRGAIVEGREEIFRSDPQLAVPTRKKIQEAYDALSRHNHYETLGIRREASRDEIRRAYFRLAKDYHPDRHFQAGLEDLTPLLEALFRRITEAYETLLMDPKRKEYDTNLVMGKTAERPESAAEPTPDVHIQKGEHALMKGDIRAAIYFFESAVKSAPEKPKPHALLARALTRMSGRQRDAETHFKKAIELDPSGVDHYLGLGMLYKRSGMNQRAQRQFEEALIWDPENQTAKEELKKLRS